jgi:hypothetical protein
MRKDVRYVLLSLFVGAALPVLFVSLLVLTNVDYRPKFDQIKPGMPKAEVMKILEGVELHYRIEGPYENIHFQEPDLFPSYFYDIHMKDGVVIETDYDL